MVTAPDIPGLNLDWLNVDTEQGMTAEPGRSGMTLQQINQSMYGADDLDEVRNRVIVPRGSARRVGTRALVDHRSGNRGSTTIRPE